MKTVLLVGSLMSLVACSDDVPQVNEAQAAAAIANAQVSADGKPIPGLPVSDKKAALAPGAVPPAFDGRWGMMPADCDVARSDTKGLLVVRDSTFTFYESTAKAKVVGGPSRYKIVTDLAFTGEGQSWQARETYELTSAGTVLLRSGESPAKTYRYERC